MLTNKSETDIFGIVLIVIVIGHLVNLLDAISTWSIVGYK